MAKKKKRITVQEKFDAFLERLSEMLGPSLFRDVKNTFVERPTTFRINVLKAGRSSSVQVFKNELLADLQRKGFKVKRVEWYRDAFILLNKSKRDLQKLDMYMEGEIYLQSLASMVPVVVLGALPGESVLDLTAAPGSKTSQIAADMMYKGELVANDMSSIRFEKLEHNLNKLGVMDENDGWKVKLHNEPGQILAREYDGYFDKILLDAPCTAEARFCESKPNTYAFWRKSNIKEMAFVQRKLLFAAWAALKPGGVLVYSTCTFAPEENEMQISRFLERTSDAEILDVGLEGVNRLPVLKKWNEVALHSGVKKCFRIKPSNEIEGFFVAKLEKH